MMGRKFIVQQDCYVYGGPNRSYLLVGNSRDYRLPREVSPEFIGTQIAKDLVIYGILDKGSILQIVGCKVQYNPENGNIIDYQAKVNDQTFNGVVFGLAYLIDESKSPPTFYTDWLVPSNSK